MPRQKSDELVGLRYTTGDEIAFVERIGRWRNGLNRDRREMLTLYLRAARQRSEWGEIDKGAVIAFAQRQLAAIDRHERA